MTVLTNTGDCLSPAMLDRYLHNLVNQLFKVLPIKESEESTLDTYLRSLQAELLGCNSFIVSIHNDPLLISLLSILQYLIDHPECSVKTVRREVFKAISICNKLTSKYSKTKEDGEYIGK